MPGARRPRPGPPSRWTFRDVVRAVVSSARARRAAAQELETPAAEARGGIAPRLTGPAPCASCGAIGEAAAMEYSPTGDLVCRACHVRLRRTAAAAHRRERVRSQRSTLALLAVVLLALAATAVVAAAAPWLKSGTQPRVHRSREGLLALDPGGPSAYAELVRGIEAALAAAQR